jgi:uncharacterized protein YdeI (YjbR/CyaY-like superfamily)
MQDDNAPEAGAAKDGLAIFAPEEPAAWEAWLDENHLQSAGVWLRLYKKDSGKRKLTYEEAVVIALCFGWIDGVKQKGDDESFLQRFTPRKKGSAWSEINTARVERLIQAGRMRAAGLKEVEAAKVDGRWARAYAPQSKATAPEDFMQELRKDKQALAFYESLNKVNQYAISYRLQTAKKPETRQKRLQHFLAMMKNGEKFFP